MIVPEASERASFIFQNISSVNMFIEFGAARATASLTSGAVSSCSVTNAGFGYSIAPTVKFLGGALRNRAANPTYTIADLADGIAPSHPAMAHCVMTGSAPNMTVASITIDDPGAGYAMPPYVELINNSLDPFGCAVPSATNGIELLPQGSFTNEGVVCSTDQIAVFCTNTSSAYTFKYTL